MDQIAVGTAKGPFNGFEQERQKTFARMVEIMKAQGLDPK